MIRGRTVEAVTPGDRLPAAAGDDATVIDGRGMTLLPGLIDAHTHSFGLALEDALNFGVTTVLDMGAAHGASVHRELELLVRAGLSPFEALRAATAVPADAFGLDDRRRIVPGMKADLVLVRGDATRDVAATRDLAGIWKDGVRVERVRPEAVLPGRPRIAPRVLTDFEDLTSDDLAASGWIPSTDAMFGGGSTVDLRVAAVGADGDGRALVISGDIGAGFPAPWAGVMIGLAPGMMQPVDASDITALVFDARGEGATYRVLAFAESLGPMPATVEFTADSGWRRIVVPLGGIDGLDPTGAMGF